MLYLCCTNFSCLYLAILQFAELIIFVMSAIKVVLRKKKNKDGTLPLAIRITRDRKASFIHLGYNLFEKHWDKDSQRVKKSHPNSVRMNNLIAAKVAEANDKSLELDVTKKYVSAKAVTQKIKPTAGSSVFSQADLYITRLKED